MNLPTSIAVTALGLVFGANAFAQSTTPELTRAEVRAQLVQAEADGLVPTRNNDYPPSAVTIARNKEIYAIRHKNGSSDAMASAANPAGSGGTSE
ncbi:hypothetical protein LMG28614_03559 [Paraburkholderia ultramafica]|uniref:DUF4148 domain-containing protein n=1 Tax=Paraburkholderia ultramafica TaxID=1544867 RepID=A0A6S7BR49_9BURK|nr:DUF4148 domain-containing protein [Paraburkholderia ultramafica]CAB3792572.1 hypothetical protein LMG28614_03559 [Paraburkholderia ultramafica]